MVNAKLALDITSTWLTFKLVLAYQCTLPRRDTASDFQVSLSLAKKSWVVIALFVFGCVVGKLVSMIDWF